MMKYLLISLGVTATVLSAWGAWEHQHAIEGRIGYLTLAAPLVAATAALIPLMVERYLLIKQYVKAAAWGAVLVPVAALIFLVVAERVHTQKAAAQATRDAAKAHVARLVVEYEEAKRSAARASGDASLWRTRAKCNATCREKHDDAATSALERQHEAAERLRAAEVLAPSDSPLSAPAWLLPLTLDLLAFLCIWSAFSMVQAKKRRRRRLACGVVMD